MCGLGSRAVFDLNVSLGFQAVRYAIEDGKLAQEASGKSGMEESHILRPPPCLNLKELNLGSFQELCSQYVGNTLCNFSFVFAGFSDDN